MNIMRLEDLAGHDVFEFAFDSCVQNKLHWNKSSIYVSDEDFQFLSKYLDQIIKNYHYYGPQKVYIKEWKAVKELVLMSVNENKNLGKILKFFNDVDIWFKCDPQKLDFFWIYGL